MARPSLRAPRPALALLLLPALGALVQGAPQAAPADQPSLVERVEARARPLLEELVARGLPGASLGLVLPDGEQVALAVGVDELPDGRPLSPRDRMLSGSVGKTYVTALAHLLVHEGVLSLDERVAARFEARAPESPERPEWLERVPNAREVTLRQLLGHTSGFPRYVFQPAFARDLAADPERTWRPEDLLSYVFDLDPLFAPGQGFAYSDTSYVVAGMTIEAATGKRYYDLVRERLLVPHGLADTIPSDGRRLPGVVQGHVVAGRQLGVPERTLVDGVFAFNPQFEWCGGGYASTPLDLARWAGVLFDGRAFAGDYLATLLEPRAATGLGPGVRYGLGAMLREGPAGPSLGHDGFMPGYLATMAWYPEHRIAGALQLGSDDARAVGRPLAAVLDGIVAAAAEELAR